MKETGMDSSILTEKDSFWIAVESFNFRFL